MVSDNELLDDVRTVLHAEVIGVTANSPALLAAVRRKQSRRRWAWLAVPLVTAAAAAAVVLTPAAPRTTAPVEVAQVLQQTNSALDGVRGMVIHEQAPAGEGEKYFKPGEKGLSERWHAADGSAFRYRASVDGKPVVDLSRSAAGDIFVDHRARTYRSLPGETPSDDDVWTPEKIQKAIKDGRITVTGPGDPVNGKQTVRLNVAAGKAEPATEMWVDATTYLPMRWHWVQDGAATFDVTWLPPTPENLAQLKTQIPDGFTEVR